MILVSDANVLTDLGYVDGLSLLTQLAPTEVLDVVLLECEHEQQPSLVAAIQDFGMSVVATEASWVRAAKAYKAAELSLQDRLNLFYAKTYGRILLAGDPPLRNRCVAEGVEVHGSLWLVEQAFAGSLVAPQDLYRWLEVWPTLGRRLPEGELRQLAQRLGCELT